MTAKVTTKAPGRRVTLRYRWLRNGEPVANAISKSIDLSRHAFRKGDRVRVRVTAVAGSRSTTKTSTATVVGDAAPKTTSLAIDPAAPTAGDTLSATLRASDIDGDHLSERRTWSWTCAGSASRSIVASTITLSDLGIGHGCRVSLSDRVSDGDRAVVAPAPAVVIGDRAPQLGLIRLAPSSPTADEDVTASAPTSDVDGDPVTTTCTWRLNSTPVGTDACTLDLGTVGARRDDILGVTMVASDGIATTSATAQPVTIVNSPPILDHPSVAYDPSTATATIDAAPVDADGDQLQTTVRWTIDGFDAGSSATLDLAGADAHLGDVIGALVRVTDSQGASSGWLAATPATISSGAPASPPMNDWHPYTELNGSPVHAILPVQSDPSHLYVMDELGFGWSTDAGATWNSTSGPCGGDGFAAAYAASAPQTIYAGCANDGTYRSDDGGATWQNVSITSGSVTMGTLVTWGISALAVDPTNPDVVYAVCSNCSSIWRTADGGQTWQTIGTAPRWGASVAIDPNDPAHVVVGSANGVLVSHDGGATWAGPYGSGPMLVAFDSNDTSRLWAIVYEQSTPSLQRSADGGVTWTTVTTSPTQLSALAVADGVVYVADKTGDISQSMDDGATWSTSQLHSNYSGGGLVSSLAVDPTDANHVYVGFDGGGVWGLEFRPDLPQGWSRYNTVRLDSVSTLTPTTATLNATVAPLLPGDTGWVEWQWGSTSTADNTTITTVTGSATEQAVSTTLTGLTPNTTYHLIAVGFFNDSPGGTFTSGTQEVTFTTPPA